MKCVTGIRAQDLGRLTAAAAGRRRGAQDLALIHLARDVMLRPQEIPALTWDRMVFLDDGTAYLTLPGPGGRCVKRPVSGYTVRLLAALLPDDGIPEGGQIFSLTCSQINRRVGSLCEAAGMPGEYAASSPRVGKAIDLADSGMSVEDLRAYGRWRSLDSAWAYVQRSPSYAKVALVGQARYNNSPFNFSNWSLKEPLTGDWKKKIRDRIAPSSAQARRS